MSDLMTNGFDDGPIAMHGEVFDEDGHVRVKARHHKHQRPKNCWNTFTDCFRRIWQTKYTDEIDEDNHEKLIGTTIRELIIYLVFLTLLCVITMGMQTPIMYYFTDAMKHLFLETPTTGLYPKTFLEFTHMDEFWDYLEGPMLDGIYWEKYYDEPEPKERLQYVFHENKLLGLPRLRMLKVRNDSCIVPEAFEREIKECFDAYDPQFEDSRPFGPRNDTAWVHHKDMDASSSWGQVATYPPNGFYQTLSYYKNETQLLIAKLKKDRWIDRGTRVVFLDFTTYNPNANLFCVVKLTFEFPPTGGLMASSEFRTVKLIRYVSTFDYFILAMEAIFLLFVIYYVVEEVIEISKWRCSYFSNFWNVLDVVVLSLALVAVAFTVYRTINVTQKLDALLQNPEVYANFEFISYAQDMFNIISAIMAFCAWVKIFKYVSFNKTMNQLSTTLSRCAKDVGGFAIMFFIFFFAYAQLGYLLFGTQVKDFSTFYDAVFSLLRTMLGDFEFHQLEQANRILGPIFFITYVFFVFFVLLNMFLAIINDTYAEVKSELATQQSELEMGDYFKQSYYQVLRRLNLKKDRITDIQNVLHKGQKGYANMEFDEWKETMLKKGYQKEEIEATFHRYDVDNDGVLDSREQEQLEKELQGFKHDLDRQINEQEEVGMLGDGITIYEFNVLNRRVDRAEMSLSAVAGRIDAAIRKLEFLDRSKMQHRERMTQKMIELDAMGENPEGAEGV